MKQKSRGFVPFERKLEAIKEEDKEAKPWYDSVFQEDEEVTVKGLGSDPLYME